MNSMAIRFGDDIIVVDAGMMFPDDDLLGVDIVTPDFTYLEQNKAHVRGLILTHGHEDHIGGIPFLLSQVNIRFTVRRSRWPWSKGVSKNTTWSIAHRLTK